MDPNLWLEDVTSDDALAWVRQHNDAAIDRLAGPRFAEIEARALAVLDSSDRIAFPRRRGEWLYNFWVDAEHERGLWRRTTLDSYRTDEPDWDVVIDVDALAAAEDTNWVWKGAAVLRADSPDGLPFDRALVSLSRGGADASVVREYSISQRRFIPAAEGGFELAEAKSDTSWIDAETIYVGTDFGPGSLTASGYPRIAKRWTRGTELAAAVTVFEASPDDVYGSVGYSDEPGYERHFAVRGVDFHHHELFELDPQSGALTLVDVPSDADADLHGPWLLVMPRTPWLLGKETVEPGGLVAFDFAAFRDGSREFTTLFSPDAHTSLQGFTWTKNYLVLALLRDVKSELRVLATGSWEAHELAGLPANAEISVAGTDPRESDEILCTANSFTLPTTLLYGDVEGGVAELKSTPPQFDAADIVTEQLFATSADGTAIPYFLVRKAGSGPGPTLLYGYGGFEISLTPSYLSIAGGAWLERGGAYVIANIRGGGEYGPTWHTSVLKQNRMRCYEDFSAVAQDLVARGVCRREQLGAQGGSNGGLLMGVMYTRYPELFGAIVCQVPLLDMQRYHLLLAGASWVAEYGDPDVPDEWAALAEYSPYQNLPTTPAAETDVAYPALLVTTSTRDDRVHPGHARKFVAALDALGYPVTYYENIEGGHAGAADNKQSARKTALAYEFLWEHLGG